MIDKNFIERVKSSLNIVNVVSEFISLQRAGVNWKGICPFHDDSHPSMVVSQVRQTYHCFVCGAHGDVIAFIQHHLNLDFTEALKWCCDKAGLEFPSKELTKEEVQNLQQREARLVAMKAAAEFYRSQLSQAATFLHQRGYPLDDKTLSEYGVGYAPEGNVAVRTLTEKGYSFDRLVEVGVAATSQQTGQRYDVFRDRVMFPFYDLQGHVIAFSGRIVQPKEKVGKYVNTGSTPIFTKGDHLYGLYQARKAIGKEGFVYLVEGQFDVLSLHKVGVENVIGGSGTAFTDQQVKLITRFTQSVVMVYDADPAGQKAALKNCELLLKAGTSIRCIRLPKGMDPDELARKYGDCTAEWLKDNTISFPSYFRKTLIPRGNKDSIVEAEALNKILGLIAQIEDSSLRMSFIAEVSKSFSRGLYGVEEKVRDIRRNVTAVPSQSDMKTGIYGLDVLKEHLESNKPAVITHDFQAFLDGYGDSPILYISGIPSTSDIEKLRSIYGYFICSSDGCSIDGNGNESDYLHALADMFRLGITNMTVSNGTSSDSFLDFYIDTHSSFLVNYEGDRTPLVLRCIELTVYVDDAVITINRSNYCSMLHITKGQFEEIRKPLLAKRKSKIAISSQSDGMDDNFDYGEELPDYVEENEDYKRMWKECGFFPRLGKGGKPLCYMFRNKNGNGMTQVGDFFMTPLLHIYNDDYDQNKRVLRIDRRYYDTPIYIEVLSKSLLKKSTIEEILINLDAVNFTNGEESHWTKIREYMSRRYVICSEVEIYGNQQDIGTSRLPSQQFFAFANGIFHFVDGVPTFSQADELGVVMHEKKNYYLPAFSTIYAGSEKKKSRYDLISQLVYREVPKEKQVSFERWSSLMNEVYKVNDNGKWAIIYAIMCAFRSNIHCLERLFTAPFFMGPTGSGKTQIAISIRSLFISPSVAAFNLNTGTDAALSTIMSTFRDVPVVLEEYKNYEISDYKFQALKAIVYDGDGKQKRKAAGSKEIEEDKVYAPVVICGQDTPQRDDNALMNRVIICEVPYPTKSRTPEEVRLFEELKRIEDPNQVGLSNVLLQVLALRPLFMDHFPELRKEAYKELTHNAVVSGQMDRIMKTMSFFLGTVKLIEQYTELRLPFTYREFFDLALKKIDFQMSLIQSTDKLATFFTAMNTMIDTGSILEGRDFTIEQPKGCTLINAQGNKTTITFEPGTNVLFLRTATVFSYYDRSSFNTERTTKSTIDQNLRSHPSYIGQVSSHRFEWEEVEERCYNPMSGNVSRQAVPKGVMTSATVLDYDKFLELYNMDFRRSTITPPDQKEKDEQETDDAPDDSPQAIPEPQLPFVPDTMQGAPY